MSAAIRFPFTHPVHRLLAFGGLTLVDDGAPITGAGSQRSRLALLAVLACAGSAGISREKLLGFLWPESDEERARHALKQSVYSLRRDLGSESAITGTASLALDPTVITSDVRDFDEALARGDDEAAVAFYVGPFLDGIFLRNSTEFDRWSDGERTRFQRAYLDACARLAMRDSAVLRHADAVGWWRLAAASDPLSGRIALDLMRALAQAGDVSGAIRHGAVHAEMVRAELDSPADDGVVAFTAQLRSGEWKPLQEPVTATMDVPSPALPAPPAVPARREGPIRGRPRVLVAVAAVMLLMVAAFLAVTADRRGAVSALESRGHPSPSPRRIVVAPFMNRTGDSTLNPLSQLTADWLARSLLEARFEVVDSRTAVIASQLLSTLPGVQHARGAGVALAEETGAGMVLTGNYYLQGDSLQFEASVTDIARQTVVRTIGPLRGRVSDATRLVGTLASRVAASLAAFTDSTAGAPTSALGSPPSLEAFEHTSRAWAMFFSRPADTAAVFAELDRAAATDSTYVAPLLMRAYVLDVKARWASLDAIVRRLQPRRRTLGRSEQAALELFEADLRGDLVGRLRASRELARLSPGSADMALLVAVSASYLMRPAEARDALIQSDPDRGVNRVSPMYWAWRAAASHGLAAYDDERAVTLEGARRFPLAPAIDYARVRVAAVAGRVRAIDDVIAKAAARSRAEAADLLQLAARELRAHGHEAEAVALFARAASQPAPSANVPREDRHRAALALYEAGRLDEAHQAFAALLAEDASDLTALGRLGCIAARTKDVARTHAIDARLARWSAPFAFGEPNAWRAHIAAVDGRSSDAVALLRAAIADGFRPYDLGAITVHDEGDFMILRTQRGFLDLIRPHAGQVELP